MAELDLKMESRLRYVFSLAQRSTWWFSLLLCDRSESDVANRGYFHSYHTLTNLMCYSIKTSCPYFWLSVVSRFFYIRIVTGGVLLPDKGKAEGATVHRTISKAD